MADYESLIQKPSGKPIGFNKGNSFSLTFTFAFDLTLYTIESYIIKDSIQYNFEIIEGSFTATSSTFSIYLSPEISATITEGNGEWFLNLIKTNVKRTYFNGTCKVM